MKVTEETISAYMIGFKPSNVTDSAFNSHSFFMFTARNRETRMIYCMVDAQRWPAAHIKVHGPKVTLAWAELRQTFQSL